MSTILLSLIIRRRTVRIITGLARHWRIACNDVAHASNFVPFVLEGLESRICLSAPTQWNSRGPGGGGAFLCPSFSPFNPAELYVTSDMSGVYHSTNTGASWQILPFGQLQGGRGARVQFTSNRVDPLLTGLHRIRQRRRFADAQEKHRRRARRGRTWPAGIPTIRRTRCSPIPTRRRT